MHLLYIREIDFQPQFTGGRQIFVHRGLRRQVQLTSCDNISFMRHPRYPYFIDIDFILTLSMKNISSRSGGASVLNVEKSPPALAAKARVDPSKVSVVKRVRTEYESHHTSFLCYRARELEGKI